MKKKDIVLNLNEKSVEAFLLAIEIYNKPTIKYRIEGFTFFICNAWELLLKAKIASDQGIDAIYFPNKSGGVSTRTISLSNCIEKVFTNNKDFLRLNLEEIVKLRDTSTHYIIQEYEILYNSFFQSCLLNYIEKINSFFAIDVMEKISTSMLNILIDDTSFDKVEMIKKYDEGTIAKFEKNLKRITKLVEGNGNEKLAISINHNICIVKDPSKAESSVSVAKDAKDAIMFVDKPRNANLTHPYNGKRLIEAINKVVKSEYPQLRFNYSELKLYCEENNVYTDQNFCYTVETDANPKRTFSKKLIERIINDIKKNPQIFENLKNKS